MTLCHYFVQLTIHIVIYGNIHRQLRYNSDIAISLAT